MSNDSNPALQGSGSPGRSVRLSVSLPPAHRPRAAGVGATPPGTPAYIALQFGTRPMLRAALRVLQATRRIWREPLA